jgi:glycosyltransferase involved in cell wall biosynthesis
MDRTYEVIYVDDSCPEGSGGLVEKLVGRDDGIVLFKHAVNQGQSWAVFHGLQRARGDKIVIMDADLQDEPEHLPSLFEQLERGDVEAVFAGRSGEYQATSRMKTSRVFKWLMCLVLGVPRDAGSYVVMTRRMADAILAMRSRFPYMLALIGGTRLPVRSMPVLRATRPFGRSAYGDWARLKMAYRGLRTALEVKWMN